MNKTIFVLGMLVVFAFTPSNIETAKADVDISGQCVDMILSGGGPTDKHLDDVCRAAGFYACVAGSTSRGFLLPGCVGGGWSSIGPLDCDNDFWIGATAQSVSIPNLVCEDIRPWGVVPRPGNVPSDFNQTILNLTNWILGFITMIAVLALIWGGVNYLTSAGDEDRARSGKKIIQYALMGLVIAGLAYALVVVIVGTILV